MIGKKLTAFICFVILAGGAGLIYLIFNTEPKAVREGATRETAMLVEVLPVKKGTYQPVLEALGTVVPAKDILLRPRVGGEVVFMADSFTPGGFVEKGEVLLRIDPADYEIRLEQRKSELLQAETDLKIEEGRQSLAEKEFKLLESTGTEVNRSLVLREPQLKAAEAKVRSARAAVEQAKLDLERTTVAAPFDAQILTRMVNLGSQVSSGVSLGRLVGVKEFWVEATVPLAKLRWLAIPEGPEAGPAVVEVRHRTAWPKGTNRQGRLYKMMGELEGPTRMARVLISVEDPLARSIKAPSLVIGSFVEARIPARNIPGVVQLSRQFLRNKETVWVMKENVLSIRQVEVVFRDREYAYIGKGLEDGEWVVTTNLSTVVDGAPLRRKDEAGEDATR